MPSFTWTALTVAPLSDVTSDGHRVCFDYFSTSLGELNYEDSVAKKLNLSKLFLIVGHPESSEVPFSHLFSHSPEVR